MKGMYKHTQGTSTLLCFWQVIESCEVSDRQNQSVVNAFIYVCSHPTMHTRMWHSRLGHCKISKKTGTNKSSYEINLFRAIDSLFLHQKIAPSFRRLHNSSLAFNLYGNIFMHPILLNILNKVIVYQKPTGKQETLMKISFLCSKIVFYIKWKSFLSTIKSISQALGYTFQTLGCTSQALGYTSQTLGHNFHHRERTYSPLSKNNISVV